MTKIKDLLHEEIVAKVEKAVSDKDIIEGMKIPFIPVEEILLIKPLDKVRVVKTLTVADDEANGELREKAKETGELAHDIVLKTKEVEKEVDSIQRIGILIAVNPQSKFAERYNIKVGDKVVYHDRSALPFDLLHNDAVLVKSFDIVGFYTK